MNKEKNNNKKKHPFIALALCLVLVITGIFAFLTSTDSKTNTFEVGSIEIELNEDDWYDDDGNLIVDNKVVNKTLATLKTELEADGYTVTEAVVDSNNTLTAVKGDETITYTEKTVNEEVKVFESNGINDFAENVIPGDEIGNAPYISNVGKNNAWTYIVLGMPVVEEDQLISAENGDTPIETAKFKIKVLAYGIQPGYVNKQTETSEEVWNKYTTKTTTNDQYVSMFGEETSETNLAEIFESPVANTGWTQLGSTYCTDDYNYYVFSYSPADTADKYDGGKVLPGVDTEPVIETVKIREIIGASETYYNENK